MVQELFQIFTTFLTPSVLITQYTAEKVDGKLRQPDRM
jgi:hypothetical protein